MYQVIARKFRPRTFKEMLGQEPLVTTLKNAIRLGRLPHAYLFSGPRGTGKTSVARLFAKAINCDNRTSEDEPCNQCSSCLEIQNGTSMDVLEIDGASNRGIDDIRKINETIGFSALSGRYKIYIIDEVHMLTKEAFNALLKTLEEPPPKVKFLFATTEVHKVLPTILSRCQRFQLKRIPPSAIIKKLQWIASELKVEVEEEALRLIAKRAEGGLRDAESLFDQIISFQDGKVTAASTSEALGVPSKETLFSIDSAVEKEDYAALQSTARSVFEDGKDLVFFYDCLVDHFRTLLLSKLKAVPPLLLSEGDLLQYETNQAFYTKESLMAILDFLIEAQSKARTAPLTQTSLEQTLYKILRLSTLESVGMLVRRLGELEKRLSGGLPPTAPPKMPAPKAAAPASVPYTPPSPSKPTPPVAPAAVVAPAPVIIPPQGQTTSAQVPPAAPPVHAQPAAPTATAAPASVAITVAASIVETASLQPASPPVLPLKKTAPAKPEVESISIDPTPSLADFKGVKPAMKAPSEKRASVKSEEAPSKIGSISTPVSAKIDTLLQFAAIELEGKITKL